MATGSADFFGGGTMTEGGLGSRTGDVERREAGFAANTAGVAR